MVNLATLCGKCHYTEHAPKVEADVLAWKELLSDGA